MADRSDLGKWALDAVRHQGGEATVLDVAKAIWGEHEDELKASDDLFYTRRYDMRWAADRLRKAGKLELSGRKWALA